MFFGCAVFDGTLQSVQEAGSYWAQITRELSPLWRHPGSLGFDLILFDLTPRCCLGSLPEEIRILRRDTKLFSEIEHRIWVFSKGEILPLYRL